jgi:hypothetical protein
MALRRLTASRTPTAVAVAATIVAVLAVMLPGLGFGQVPGIQGGSPTVVYMNKNQQFCATVDSFGGAVIRQDVTLEADSHLMVLYTFEWGGLNERLEGHADIALLAPDGTVVDGSNEWSFPGGKTGRLSSTVHWSFENVPTGSYEVYGAARVDAAPGGTPHVLKADLSKCALTVFVIPPGVSPPTPSASQSPSSPSPPPSPPSVAGAG